MQCVLGRLLKFALIEREKGSASDRMGQVRPKHGMVATAAAVVHQSEAWFNFTNPFCTKQIFFCITKVRFWQLWSIGYES